MVPVAKRKLRYQMKKSRLLRKEQEAERDARVLAEQKEKEAIAKMLEKGNLSHLKHGLTSDSAAFAEQR
eukprot:2878281-Amphidinium_carterae.4